VKVVRKRKGLKKNSSETGGEKGEDMVFSWKQTYEMRERRRVWHLGEKYRCFGIVRGGHKDIFEDPEGNGS